jgi:type 1 glutamine amidotransferase
MAPSRSQVLFLWWASMAPPPISMSLASRGSQSPWLTESGRSSFLTNELTVISYSGVMVPGRLICVAALLSLGCGDNRAPTVTDGGRPLDGRHDGVIHIIVFSKTEGYRHASIPDCIALLEELGATGGWRVSATEDAAELVATLDSSDVVIFCSTTGDVLDAGQEAAFERFVRDGGGFVGIHSAASTEYDWPFYGELLGTWFDNHPAPQLATMNIEDTDHPATIELPASLSFDDEWYNFQVNPRGVVTVLATLDETSYEGGDMGSDHPIMWYRDLGGGRAFYVGPGHRSQTYASTHFRAVIRGAVDWAAARD